MTILGAILLLGIAAVAFIAALRDLTSGIRAASTGIGTYADELHFGTVDQSSDNYPQCNSIVRTEAGGVVHEGGR